MASVHPRRQLLPFTFGEPRQLSKGQPEHRLPSTEKLLTAAPF